MIRKISKATNTEDVTVDNIYLILVVVLFVLVFTPCLLESFDPIGTEFEIDKISVVRKNPILYYSDFICYNLDEFAFEISDNSGSTIENLQHALNGLAFTRLTDKELIYTGSFWQQILQGVATG